jgi:hypothetical protein
MGTMGTAHADQTASNERCITHQEGLSGVGRPETRQHADASHNGQTTPRETIMNRTNIERLAETLNYDLSPATDRDRMEAANQGETMPRWTLNPVGNQGGSAVIRCGTLAEVAEELDHLEISR